MNNILYIIGLCIALFGSSETAGQTAANTEAFQNTVILDDSNVDRRNYSELKENYTGNDFIYERSVEDSGWWVRFKRWLSELFKDLFNFNTDAQASDVVDLALKLFYVVILILVLYFIVRAVMNKEGKWIFGKSSKKSIINVTDVENNIHQTDFGRLIQEAETENNYRLAVRYHYLWSLKSLTDHGLIDYDVEKTNSDYVLEISSEELKQKFSYASYLYNYIWYGEFGIDLEQYSKAKRAFANLINGVKP